MKNNSLMVAFLFESLFIYSIPQVSEFTNGELEIELDSPSPVVGDENIKVPTVKEVPETKTPPTAVKEGGVVKENKEPQRRDSTLKRRCNSKLE